MGLYSSDEILLLPNEDLVSQFSHKNIQLIMTTFLYSYVDHDNILIFCKQISKIPRGWPPGPPFHTNPPVALRAPVMCCAHHHHFLEPPLAETCVRACEFYIDKFVFFLYIVRFIIILLCSDFDVLYQQKCFKLIKSYNYYV